MMTEVLMTLSMICASEDHIARRDVQHQANCIAFMLGSCPDDLADKAEMIACLKAAALKAKTREFDK